MPKQPGGIAKSKRMQTVLDVLERWGKLDKNAINQRVAAALDIEEAVIKRVLYRDLEELVEQQRIKVFHQTPDDATVIDGHEVDERPPTFKSFWALNEYGKFDPMGIGVLHEAGADLITSEFFSKLIFVKNVSDIKMISNFVGLSLKFANSLVAIAVAKEHLPMTIVVGRKTNQDLSTSYELVKNNFGIRSSLLLLPFGQVSSVKSGRNVGHFAVTFDANLAAEIIDLGSTNGTLVANRGKVKNPFDSIGDSFFDERTEDIESIKRNYIMIRKLNEFESHKTERPCTVFLPGSIYVEIF